MRVVSLASGSAGNAYAVESNGRVLLIDCGITWRKFKEMTSVVGEWIASNVDGVLITHSHTDHISGVKTLLRHMDVPVYANSMTAESVSAQEKLDDSAFICFENGQEFDAGSFHVRAFSIPHDTSDPVGYLISADGQTYFHGTDIGSPLDSIGLKLREADIATLESNHDPIMLNTSNRPPSLIQRIAGPRGHLANDQACDLIRRFASAKLKTIALAHLSRDCNSPHVAEGAMKATLLAMGRTDIDIKILRQDMPCLISGE